MKNLFRISVLILMTGLIVSSCKKDDEPVPVTGEALFTYEANGMVITFTNTSTVSGEVTYLWDFGDSLTSDVENPVHTYAVKGEYLVSLIVTDALGGTHPIATKVVADKATRIDLADASFADWNVVTEAQFIMSTGGELAGIIKSAKIDYDGENVYIYVEYEGSLENGTVLDIFFDTDNDTLTGNRGWMYPQMGSDDLFEGQITKATEPVVPTTNYYFKGVAQSDWSWGDDKPFATGFYTLGHQANSGSNCAIEIGFDRSKFKGLDNSLIKIGVFLQDPATWAIVGFAPNKAVNGIGSGILLDMR